MIHISSLISLKASQQQVFTSEITAAKTKQYGMKGKGRKGFRAGSANLESHLRVVIIMISYLYQCLRNLLRRFDRCNRLSIEVNTR